jgi:hypothetical protein
MKTGFKAGLGIAALAGTLATGMFIGAAFAGQPHMMAALDALRTARSELLLAEHNKMGHRAEALRLVNQAISEVQEGMADAN